MSRRQFGQSFEYGRQPFANGRVDCLHEFRTRGVLQSLHLLAAGPSSHLDDESLAIIEESRDVHCKVMGGEFRYPSSNIGVGIVDEGSKQIVVENPDALESAESEHADISVRMPEMSTCEFSISRMSGDGDFGSQSVEFARVVAHGLLSHRRLSRAVTIHAMADAVTSATMMPTKAAMEPDIEQLSRRRPSDHL